MKIKYELYNGEYKEIEVSEDVGNAIIEAEKEANNLDRKERYHCTRYGNLPYNSLLFTNDKYSPEVVYEKELNSKKLLAALDTLTPIQKKRLLMYTDGMSVTEIADAEGVSKSSVSISIKSAQKRIKNLLKFY